MSVSIPREEMAAIAVECSFLGLGSKKINTKCESNANSKLSPRFLGIKLDTKTFVNIQAHKSYHYNAGVSSKLDSSESIVSVSSPSVRSRRISTNQQQQSADTENTEIMNSGVNESSHSKETELHGSCGTSRRRLITLGVAAAAMACPACSLTSAGGRASASEVPWSYGTLSGPPSWGAVCSAGKKQSPIDLPMEVAKELPGSSWGNLEFAYNAVSPSFLNTGHGTMQVDFPKGKNRLILGDRTLELLQYHFHAPSEHSFDGKRAAMEAHLVHRDDSGRLAVIGVMLIADPKSPRNACLQAALEFAPEQKSKKIPAPVSCFFGVDPEQEVCPSLVLSPARLLPKPDGDGKYMYMNYEGSLTTPPCSEGVDWFVLADPVRVPGQQILEFMKYVGDGYTFSMNSRPIQPLNDRVISVGA